MMTARVIPGLRPWPRLRRRRAGVRSRRRFSIHGFPRAIHDDVAGADLEDLAVELHQSPPRHDHVQLVVVVVVRVRADLRSGWDDGEVDEAAVAHVTSLEHTGRENGASPTMGDLGPKALAGEGEALPGAHPPRLW